VINRKNVSACDRQKPDGCNPKNDFDRDLFVGALCLTFILKLNPLFIYIYICMFKNDIFPCGTNRHMGDMAIVKMIAR